MWVVTVHDHGGSKGEAIDVVWSFSAANEAQAEGMAEHLNSAFQAIDAECYAQHFEVKPIANMVLPPPSPAQLAELARLGQTPQSIAGAKPGDPGAQVVDLQEVARVVSDQDEWHSDEAPFEDKKPPKPVSPEEEADALRSILGG